MQPNLPSIPPWLENGCDLMTDIETLSTEPNAIILSIGALKFNPQHLNTEEDIGDFTFYQNICRVDSERYGLHKDQQTIMWWAQQDESAQKVLLEDPRPLVETIQAFNAFLFEHPRVSKVWAKDPDFDVVILREAFKAARLGGFPIPFYNNRSVRTIQDLAYPNFDDMPVIRCGTHHNALDDCYSQALMVQHCHKMLGLHPNSAHPIL